MWSRLTSQPPGLSLRRRGRVEADQAVRVEVVGGAGGRDDIRLVRQAGAVQVGHVGDAVLDPVAERRELLVRQVEHRARRVGPDSVRPRELLEEDLEHGAGAGADVDDRGGVRVVPSHDGGGHPPREVQEVTEGVAVAQSRAKSVSRQMAAACCALGGHALTRRAVLGGVLQVRDLVVAELLEQAVLPGQQAQRLAVGAEVLGDRVLRDVERVAGLDLVPGRLVGDPGVVLVVQVGGYLPVQAVARAAEDVEDLVGHVPPLAGPAPGRDLKLEDVDAERAHVGRAPGTTAPGPCRAAWSPRWCRPA